MINFSIESRHIFQNSKYDYEDAENYNVEVETDEEIDFLLNLIKF